LITTIDLSEGTDQYTHVCFLTIKVTGLRSNVLRIPSFRLVLTLETHEFSVVCLLIDDYDLSTAGYDEKAFLPEQRDKGVLSRVSKICLSTTS